MRRAAVRCRKPNGQWGVGVLICSLPSPAILCLAGSSVQGNDDDPALLQAVVALYDQRGGGIETSFKGDKQGLGLTKRHKKRFAAQQVLMLLGSLAHNVVVWAHDWLIEQEEATPLQQYGILRMVRDVFHVGGLLSFDASGKVVKIMLNQDAFLAHVILPSLCRLLLPIQVDVTLGQI